jgi:quinol monooxygenase YgiN
MTNVALFVRLEAKKGKEAEVERFLKDGLRTVNNEHETISWYALKLGPSTYGIFDTFTDNRGRDTHLNGEIAKELKKRTPELFSLPPTIEKIDILAAKMPELEHH